MMIESLYTPSDISFAFIQDKNESILVQFIANEYFNASKYLNAISYQYKNIEKLIEDKCSYLIRRDIIEYYKTI